MTDDRYFPLVVSGNDWQINFQLEPHPEVTRSGRMPLLSEVRDVMSKSAHYSSTVKYMPDVVWLAARDAKVVMKEEANSLASRAAEALRNLLPGSSAEMVALIRDGKIPGLYFGPTAADWHLAMLKEQSAKFDALERLKRVESIVETLERVLKVREQ